MGGSASGGSPGRAYGGGAYRSPGGSGVNTLPYQSGGLQTPRMDAGMGGGMGRDLGMSGGFGNTASNGPSVMGGGAPNGPSVMGGNAGNPGYGSPSVNYNGGNPSVMGGGMPNGYGGSVNYHDMGGMGGGMGGMRQPGGGNVALMRGGANVYNPIAGGMGGGMGYGMNDAFGGGMVTGGMGGMNGSIINGSAPFSSGMGVQTMPLMGQGAGAVRTGSGIGPVGQSLGSFDPNFYNNAMFRSL